MEKELLKGTLKTIILDLLHKEGRMYGYAICKEVRERSGGGILITEGALYPTLHKLEAEGLLVVEKERLGKRVRKYYSLSPEGNLASARKVREFEEFVRVMMALLKPQSPSV